MHPNVVCLTSRHNVFHIPLPKVGIMIRPGSWRQDSTYLYLQFFHMVFLYLYIYQFPKPPFAESTDSAIEGAVAEGHVTPVDQSDLQEPRDQVTPVQSDEATSLRQALEMSEQQMQLINSEYGKMLREKEVRLLPYHNNSVVM